MPTPSPIRALLIALAIGAAPSIARADDPSPPAPDEAPAPSSDAPDEEPTLPEEPGYVSTPPGPGDEVALIFNTGERAEGVLISVEPGLYVVRIAGLDVRLRPSDIASIVRLPTIEERFAQMRGLVREGDAKALLALAAWAESRGLLTRALGVVEQALDLEPQNGDALRARELLTKQIALKRMRDQDADRRAENAPDTDEEGETRESVRALVIRNFPMLNDDQINLIKVMEVNIADPPRMVIDPETVEALLRGYSDFPAMPATRAEREAFRRLPPAKILDMIFRVGARELYAQVRVIGHPESMSAFRDRVNAGWLTNAMATTRCHGGTNGGRLQLQNRKPSSPQSFYTNFLILDRFRTRDGDPLINYAQPERSPLLEMGLTRDQSIYPHPEIAGWTPIFRSRDDRAYQRTVEWIRMMYQPRPVYPITYTPPGEVGDAPPVPETSPPVQR